ncbi:MAG: zinc ribbon domain-containing protein [Methanobrevibacter sp.]|nr:zinc ribbon domain-containing protein [Methanobrevibacter sp.]
MVKNCPKCGNQLKVTDLFCPNCGERVVSVGGDDYFDIIRDIIYVDGRISKAKAIGVGFFLLYIVYFMVMLVPGSLRAGPLPFIITVFMAYFAGLFYYAICRGVGFIVRKAMS